MVYDCGEIKTSRVFYREFSLRKSMKNPQHWETSILILIQINPQHPGMSRSCEFIYNTGKNQRPILPLELGKISLDKSMNNPHKIEDMLAVDYGSD